MDPDLDTVIRQAPAMPIPPAINPKDITRHLEQRHRDAMLDLVLAWGTMDVALGMLLSRVLEMPIDQGAELIGRLPGSAKLEKVRKALRNAPGGADAAGFVKRHKKNFERHSFPRNRIAHSHCVGVWTIDQDFIVFAAFEKVDDNALALYAIPIQDMQRATRWGQAMTAVALKLADIPYAET